MIWKLEGTKLILEHPMGDLYWFMPDGFELPGASVLSLAEHLLFAPYGIKIDVIPAQSRAPEQGRTAVAYSGGVDSAAALKLLENPLPIYTQVANPGKLHKLENALLAVREVGGAAIISNQDQLPTYFGKPRGFYGAAGFTVTSVLLAEHFGLTTFADGNILEFAYLRGPNGHGTQFSKPNFNRIKQAFKTVGFEYCMPCAGLTEISTTRIADIYQFAMGCMRGEGGEPCLKCMKCYRKMAIKGNPIPTNPDVEKVLGKTWIPVLGALLWARNHCGLKHPRLENIRKDIGWVDKWYPPSVEMIPEPLQDYFFRKLGDYNIEPLQDLKSVESWSSYVPSDNMIAEDLKN